MWTKYTITSVRVTLLLLVGTKKGRKSAHAYYRRLPAKWGFLHVLYLVLLSYRFWVYVEHMDKVYILCVY